MSGVRGKLAIEYTTLDVHAHVFEKVCHRARWFVLRGKRIRDKLGSGSRIFVQLRQFPVNVSHGISKLVRFKRFTDFVESDDLVRTPHVTQLNERRSG